MNELIIKCMMFIKIHFIVFYDWNTNLNICNELYL